MEFWEVMLTVSILLIVLPAFFSIVFFLKARAEKKLNTEGAIKTRAPKIIYAVFLGFGILVLLGGIAGMIVCGIVDKEHTTVGIVVTIALCIVVFSALGFLAFAIARFNYVVADNDGVHSHKLFRKERFYRYDEIGSFKDDLALGVFGNLIAYDKNDVRIFSVDSFHIGSAAVAQRLRDHGVNEKLTLGPRNLF